MPRTVAVAPARLPGWRARFAANNPDGPQRIVSVSEPVALPSVVVLVRRGGYAVAVVGPGGVLAHKVGSRHVQSRTSAGGWSQQRFARRRANQTQILVAAVAQHLERVVEACGVSATALSSLVLGGDRELAEAVVAQSATASRLPRSAREFFGIPDPRRAVLDRVVQTCASYEITIDDGDG